MSAVLAFEEMPTISLLYKLGRLRPPTPSNIVANQAYNDKVSVIRYDITKLKVDAIVNAANSSLMGGGGVDGAIHKAAGPDLLKECSTLDGCDTGSAKITKAYKLPCKHVIHAVGPVYSLAKARNQHSTLLRGCYRRSLELAVENNLTSIAFSALSTGVYGYPSGEAAETAIGEVKTFLDNGSGDTLDHVIFCNFTEKDAIAYEEWLPKFFPPSEDNLKSMDDKEKSAPESSKLLQEWLPDPPKAEPGYAEAPDAKKQKHEHRSTDD